MSITGPQTATTLDSVTATKTGYVILRSVSQEGIDETWQKVAAVPAVSAQAAIRAYATAHQPKGSETFVAVPERSWRPVVVSTETRQVVKLG